VNIDTNTTLELYFTPRRKSSFRYAVGDKVTLDCGTDLIPVFHRGHVIEVGYGENVIGLCGRHEFVRIHFEARGFVSAGESGRLAAANPRLRKV
jgi:hypothetical protein